MSDLIPAAREKSSALNEIPLPPLKCHVIGCSNDKDVAVLQVRQNGRLLSGAFADFGYITKNGNERVYALRGGYDYEGWVTRCGKHYCEDVEACQGTALKKPANVSNAHSEHLKIKSGKDLIKILKTLSGQLLKQA